MLYVLIFQLSAFLRVVLSSARFHTHRAAVALRTLGSDEQTTKTRRRLFTNLQYLHSNLIADLVFIAIDLRAGVGAFPSAAMECESYAQMMDYGSGQTKFCNMHAQF
jgi:hypothetical protein